MIYIHKHTYTYVRAYIYVHKYTDAHLHTHNNWCLKVISLKPSPLPFVYVGFLIII